MGFLILSEKVYVKHCSVSRSIFQQIHGKILNLLKILENAIRPFVIGRNNWLSSVTPEEARGSALFYNLIETAKKIFSEPSDY